ncbi:hypothetical protein [Nocardioides convexus]|uniref:hypothetical protein n=1 Tax=Nocardioides convexus TaxID=2712224 RepID=UPI0031011E4C
MLVTGYPGTRAAFWQQVGRAGRDGGGALGMFVARDDPLDTYLVHHPEALLGRPVEGTVFDTDNPYVLGPHLCAAAQEPAGHGGRPRPLRSAHPGGARLPWSSAGCCGADQRAGSGRIARARATSPTSARPAGSRSPSSRPEPGGSSAPSTARGPTAPRTPAPCTCTAARPG